MESTSFPMCIQLSESTYESYLVSHSRSLIGVVEYGERKIKGKGMMKTYLVRAGWYEKALVSPRKEEGLPQRMNSETPSFALSDDLGPDITAKSATALQQAYQKVLGPGAYLSVQAVSRKADR